MSKQIYTAPSIGELLLRANSLLETLSTIGDADNYQYGGEFEGETYYEW